MNPVIDYTKQRPNKKLNLVKCSKCGRVGRLSKYTDGSSCIKHKGVIEFGMLSIREHCFFKTES